MKNRWFLLIVMFVVAGGTVFSQNYNDALRLAYPGIGSNARALGMGNAYSALSNDFSGTFFNPAGLGFVKDLGFTGALSSDSYKNDVTFFDNTTDYSNSSTDLSQFGFVFPVPTLRGSMVFAFGFNQVKNFNLAVKFDGFNSSSTFIDYLTGNNDDIPYELYLSNPVYDDDDNYLGDETILTRNLNQSGDITESGRINKWSFSGAVQVAENVFVGGTLNILSGNYGSDRNYYEDDTRDFYGASVLTAPDVPATADFQTFHLNDILEWDLSGWDAKLGLIYTIPENFNVGLTVKFPSFYTISESYYVDAYSEFADGYIDLPVDIVNDLSYSDWEYDIKTPYEFTGALAYSINGLTVSGEATYIDYTQTEFGDDGLDPSFVSSNNKDIKDLFTSVVNYNIGVEYVLPFPQIALRAGFIMQPSAYKDDPSDYDRKYITAGVGITPDNSPFSIDLAYAHGSWKDIGDNYGSGESRTYQDVSRANFIIAVNYKFY